MSPSGCSSQANASIRLYIKLDGDNSIFCADAISAGYRGLSARTCLSYAVFRISIEGESEFSRRPIGSKNSGDNKPKKQKAARRVRLFCLLFWRSKKVTSRRATPGNLRCELYHLVRHNPFSSIPTFPCQGKELGHLQYIHQPLFLARHTCARLTLR
jgi:hypothetical protein